MPVRPLPSRPKPGRLPGSPGPGRVGLAPNARPLVRSGAGAEGPARPGPVAHRVVLGDGWRFGPVPSPRRLGRPGADESALAEVACPIA